MRCPPASERAFITNELPLVFIWSDNMFDRIIQVIGEKSFQKLQNAHILIIGIGGVGGYALENLIRSGFENITICDYDIIEKSNINRQIIANSNNIGNLKVQEAKKRAKEINPNCQITIEETKLTIGNMLELFKKHFDFVIDACDDSVIKVELICHTMDQEIPMISCMGTGNRLHPEALEIIKLVKTKNDPLAKKIRNLLRKKSEKYLNVMVVCSKEDPLKSESLGTICPVPMTAGALLSSYVIQKILNNNENKTDK